MSFAGGDAGWVGGASDYPVAYQSAMSIVLDQRPSPGSLRAEPNSFYTYGVNNSDDLFLFIKRRIVGLEPARAHTVRICVTVAASRLGSHMIGKAGGTSFEPAVVTAEIDGPYYWMNIDKGLQSQAGRDSRLLGRLRDPADERPGYVHTTLCTREAMTVRTDSAGALWIYSGAESTFETDTEAYWLQVDVQLVPE